MVSMFLIVVILSLLAAFINAVAVIWMRRAAGFRHPKELFSRQLFLAIARRKLWLAAVALQFIGFLLQAVALNFGSVILVEPIMTMILVFLVLILHYRYNIRVGKTEWFAVGSVCLGLFMMLVAARPHGEVLNYSGDAWTVIMIIVASVIASCIWIVRRAKSPTVRAALGGIAVATNIGLTAGLTKLVVGQINTNPFTIATSWEIYALIASAVSAAIISQSAFAAGPLVISQPIIEILNPIVSGIIAVIVFSSIINTAPMALAIAIPGLILAIVGLALIGGSKRLQQTHLARPKKDYDLTWFQALFQKLAVSANR